MFIVLCILLIIRARITLVKLCKAAWPRFEGNPAACSLHPLAQTVNAFTMVALPTFVLERNVNVRLIGTPGLTELGTPHELQPS